MDTICFELLPISNEDLPGKYSMIPDEIRVGRSSERAVVVVPEEDSHRAIR
jgi:hypothetical protein